VSDDLITSPETDTTTLPETPFFNFDIDAFLAQQPGLQADVQQTGTETVPEFTGNFSTFDELMQFPSAPVDDFLFADFMSECLH
jgi:type II secretory pathway component HofQ